MKILMIAPEPVFRVRGTPFSVRDRCRGLADLGHTVDLVTYPFGDDFEFDGVRIHRTRRVPGIRDVKIGFSWAKIPLDILLFIKSFLALRRGGYDLIHTHEEAGMMGALLSRWFRLPHLYDMHSSLPQQFENYGTSSAKPVMAFMRWAEKFILKRSQGIIAICPHLKDIALDALPSAPVTVIENLAQMPGGDPSPQEIQIIRETYDLGGRFVLGYTGTFEVNQGLELLVEAFAAFHKNAPESVLFLAGGTPAQVVDLSAFASARSVAEHCRMPGKIDVEQMPAVMAACDVLVSPRIIGTNTPLKLYSYLKSGRAILATNLLTHTQVLDSETAVLVDATADGLEQGMMTLYRNEHLRTRLGAAAREKEKNFYSYPAYKAKLAQLLSTILPEGME